MELELFDPARASTQLRDGVPQQSSLGAETLEYFTFRVGAPPASCDSSPSVCVGDHCVPRAECACEAITVSVTASYGDVDVYVRAGGYPTRTRFDWSSSRGSGGGSSDQASAVRQSGHYLDDAVVIGPDDTAALPGCNGTYFVGVYARLASAYHVVASSASSFIMLQLGVTTFERTEANQTHT